MRRRPAWPWSRTRSEAPDGHRTWKWLAALTAGTSTIETEFLANIVLSDNATAGEWMIPQIDRAYRTGEMPSLLPAAGQTGQHPSGAGQPALVCHPTDSPHDADPPRYNGTASTATLFPAAQ